jgi:hypothetical protein
MWQGHGRSPSLGTGLLVVLLLLWPFCRDSAGFGEEAGRKFSGEDWLVSPAIPVGSGSIRVVAAHDRWQASSLASVAVAAGRFADWLPPWQAQAGRVSPRFLLIEDGAGLRVEPLEPAAEEIVAGMAWAIASAAASWHEKGSLRDLARQVSPFIRTVAGPQWARRQLAWLLLHLTVLGMILPIFWPRFLGRSGEMTAARPWASLGTGVAVLGFLAMLALTLAKSAFAWPLAPVFLVVLVVIIGVTGSVAVSGTVDCCAGGRGGRLSRWLSPLGVPLLVGLLFVPRLGPFLFLVVVCFGFGGWVLAAHGAQPTPSRTDKIDQGGLACDTLPGS